MAGTLPEPFAGWFARRGWAPRPHQLAVLDTARAGKSVLLTTPESLTVLVSQPASTGIFASLRVVVIDEVHADHVLLGATRADAGGGLAAEAMGTLAPPGPSAGFSRRRPVRAERRQPSLFG